MSDDVAMNYKVLTPKSGDYISPVRRLIIMETLKSGREFADSEEIRLPLRGAAKPSPRRIDSFSR